MTFHILTGTLMVLFLPGCGLGGGKNRTDMEVFHDMFQQQNIKPQEGGKQLPWEEKKNTKPKTGWDSHLGKTFMRAAPEHSRARGFSYYPYRGNLKAAERNLVNPFKGNFSPYVVGMGKRQYEKACIYCHGSRGLGKGPVALKMAVPPPSFMDKTLGYSDGRIYHVIHQGQGLMGAYREQVFTEKHRWALVNYIRSLQKNHLLRNAKNPAPRPVDVSKKELNTPSQPPSRREGGVTP